MGDPWTPRSDHPTTEGEPVELLRRSREVEQARARPGEAARHSRFAWRRPPDDGQVWLTLSVTAALLGESRAATRRAVRADRVPATRRGARWWVRRRDAEVIANARRFADLAEGGAGGTGARTQSR